MGHRTEAHRVLFGFMDMLYGRDPDDDEESEESDGFDDSWLDTEAEECENEYIEKEEYEEMD